MFQGSKGGRTMKWGTLLKDLREKVGLTQSPSSASAVASSATASSSSSAAPSSSTNAHSALHGSYSPSRSVLLYSFSIFIPV